MVAGSLQVQLLHAQAVAPSRAHDGDAGLDLSSIEHVVLAPGARATVGTGIAVAVPTGFAGLVCPRSGLASRHGVTVVNGPGVVDAGFRGEVRVVLLNTDCLQSFTIEPGDRIAQLVLVPIALAHVTVVDELTAAARNGAGFGSSGGFGGST